MQHDVAEFASCLLPRINWIRTQVMWERRTPLEGVMVKDCQRRESLLSLNPPDGLCCSDLQVAIQDWRRQSDIMTHALTNTPQTLLIQLPRFRQHAGGLRKHRIPITIPQVPIRIPEFDDAQGNTVRWTPYQVHSLITHLGDHVNNAQYRSCLLDSEDGVAWYTNDGVQAQPVSVQDSVLKKTATCSCAIAVRLTTLLGLNMGTTDANSGWGMPARGPLWSRSCRPLRGHRLNGLALSHTQVRVGVVELHRAVCRPLVQRHVAPCTNTACTQCAVVLVALWPDVVDLSDPTSCVGNSLSPAATPDQIGCG